MKRSVVRDLDEPLIEYVFEVNGLEVRCDGEELVTTMFLHSEEYGGFDASLFDIPFAATRAVVLRHFGAPNKSGPPMSDPILGEYGPWDRFARPDGVVVHVQYCARADKVDKFTLMCADEAPDVSPSEPEFVAIGRDDPEMATAHRRASETLSDLKRHLRLGDGRLCSVKLRFRDPEKSKRLSEDRFVYLWLGNACYHEDEDRFSAQFFELPAEFDKWHYVGERLLVEPERIFDWMVNDQGRLHGGFTLRVTRSRLAEDKRDEYDSHIGATTYEDDSAPKS